MELNNEQKEVIDYAKALDIDLLKYVTAEFDSNQMGQVLMGLRSNLPVHLYADIKYSWEQMREIREGLENDIEVFKYLDSNLSVEDMKKIRLTLEL